jgi:uncharacterized protein
VVKLLVDEPGSELARDAHQNARAKSASALGYVEAVAALTRMRNAGRISAGRLKEGLSDLERIWRGIDVHAVTADVVQAATRAAIDHGLRAYDSLHLATALALAEVEGIEFACWDRELRDAARERGIALLPEGL